MHQSLPYTERTNNLAWNKMSNGPMLTDFNKTKRLDLAFDKDILTVVEWRNIVFSDKKIIL